MRALTIPAVLALAAGLVLAHPVTFWRGGADEGAYLHYAERIASGGPGTLPVLVREHLADARSRAIGPSPLRLMVVLPDALAVRLAGPEYVSLQRVALTAFLALLVVAFVGFRRAVGERAALAVTLLLAVSPLQLAMARRALADSLNATLWTASLLLYVEALVGEWRRGWLLVAGVFAATLLLKEPNLTLVPIALVFLGLDAIRRRRLPTPLALAATTVLPLALAAAATVAAAGGLRPTVETFTVLAEQVGAIDYVVQFGGGPWYRYVVDFVLVSPWTMLLYVVWLGILVGERRADPRLLPWALLPPLFIAAVSSTPKFVRWAIPLDVAIRLGAVLALQRLVADRQGSPWATFRLAAALGMMMAVDVQSFLTLFVTADIYDPASSLLLRWRGFLPG